MEIVQLDVCAFGPCTRAPLVKGYCINHYQQLIKGETLRSVNSGSRTGRPRKTDLDYQAAHQRTKTVRGSASAYECVDCGSRARDWSLNDPAHPSVVYGESNGSMMAYSLDPFDYVPRCMSCHRAFDNRTAT